MIIPARANHLLSAAVDVLKRDHPIQARILALIAALLIPLMIVLGWLTLAYSDAERRVIEARRFDVATNLTYLLDARMGEVRSALTTLTQSRELARDDFEAFHRLLRSVDEATGLATAAVYEPSGQQQVESAIPWGAPLPKREDMSVYAPAFGGASYVTDTYRSLTTNKVHVAVATPVMRDGAIPYILVGAIDPLTLLPYLARAGVEPGWIVAVVDRKGRYVMRNLLSEEKLGTRAKPELVDIASGNAESGSFDNVTFDGFSVANSFRRSQSTGWTVVIAVPQAMLAAPFRQAMTIFFLGALALTLLSLSAAYVIAETIARPVRQLAQASNALVEGRQLPSIAGGITELREVEAAFNHSSSKLAQLAAIVASSNDAMVSTNADRKILSWNEGAERLFGYTAAEALGNSWGILLAPGQDDEAADAYARVFKGERIRVETQRTRKDGSVVDVALDLAPIGDAQSGYHSMSFISRDITRRKQAEAKQRFIVSELSHRTKNLLAVINSMSRQTAKSVTSVDDFVARFTKRMQGLAASHDILITQDWDAAPLRDLVIDHVQVFIENPEERLRLDGPPVNVSVSAAQAIGLALHELATNSVKYGALSIAAGHIDVTWRFIGLGTGYGDGPRQLRLTWSERDGPPVTPPAHRGFGSFVMQAMVSQSLGGTVALDYPVSGVVWTLEFPVSHLVQSYSTAPPFAKSA